jgi:hypothetical protein
MLIGVISPFISAWVDRLLGRGVVSVLAIDAAGVGNELRVRLGGISYLFFSCGLGRTIVASC